jgi:hypothetical protein
MQRGMCNKLSQDGHRSVYPSQVLSDYKITVDKGGKGSEMVVIDQIDVDPRPRSIIGMVTKIVDWVKGYLR